MIECESLENVRENIDRIDREIVKLISERSRYVKQAAGCMGKHYHKTRISLINTDY